VTGGTGLPTRGSACTTGQETRATSIPARLALGIHPHMFSRMKKLPLLLVFLSLFSVLSAAEVPMLTAAEAAKLMAEGKAVLIDVREPSEWAESGVAAPAVLLPKSEFDAGLAGDWQDFLAKVGDKQILTYCRSGRRSGDVAQALAAKGHKTANVGRFQDWQSAGLPVRKATEPAK
jgi:rhodanese-related sulfurtransferase